MKVAVTGSSGHIGHNLLPELLRKGYRVRVLIHQSMNGISDSEVEVFRGDILSRESVSDFIEGMDVVIHMAARIIISRKSNDAWRVNVDGTRNVIESCIRHKVKKLVHFSSIHSLKVEPMHETLDESRALNLNSPFDYDRSKAEGERMVVEAASKGLNAIVLNPTAVIGPCDTRPSLLGRAIIRFYQGRIPAILNGGYNWVDVRDVVQATLAAIETNGQGGKYMLSGHWKSMDELAESIRKAGGARPPLLKVPFFVAKAGAGILNALSTGKDTEKLFTPVSLESLQHSHRNISHKKATEELGYRPREFDQTIIDTLEWFRTNNYL